MSRFRKTHLLVISKLIKQTDTPTAEVALLSGVEVFLLPLTAMMTTLLLPCTLQNDLLQLVEISGRAGSSG